MASTVRIDGLPVAAGTAAAFGRLKAAFERQFPGVTLHVYSGYRSDEEQARIFLSRYRPQVSGVGPYGDVRWWNGVRYVRYSGEGTVAQPGTSNHRSGHAIDIRDSGSDAGVTVAGNARSNWIRTNAYVYGFNPAGYGFSEPWHVEYVGDPWFSPGAPANVPESNESEEDPMPKHEHKAYSGDQSLGRKGGWWPLRVSDTKQKPEHRFAATGDGQSETGDVVLTVTFGRGGTPGQELAQLRIRHQEKVGTKWVDRELTEPIDVIATTGGTTVQYALPYNLGPNYRSMVLAAGLVDDVKIAKVAYRKNYWRS